MEIERKTELKTIMGPRRLRSREITMRKLKREEETREKKSCTLKRYPYNHAFTNQPRIIHFFPMVQEVFICIYEFEGELRHLPFQGSTELVLKGICGADKSSLTSVR